MTSPIILTSDEIGAAYAALSSAIYNCDSENVKILLESARDKIANGWKSE